MKDEALSLLINECERANATGLREFGIGVIDLNAITKARRALAAPEAEKRAPVQGYPGGIPWAIHLEAYEVYCKRWGSQPALIDLEGRNCRGGFSTGELDEFIPGWRERVAEFGKLKTEVEQLRAQLAATPQAKAAQALGSPALYLSSKQVQGVMDGSLEPAGARYLPFSRQREGLFDAPVYLNAPQAERFDWSDYRAITDLPEVDEAIRTLLDDQTEDNAACMVRAIIEAAGDRLVQLSTAAPAPQALTDADRMDTERLNFIENEALELTPRATGEDDCVWEIAQFYMATPHRRVLGMGSDMRKAIDAARAASAGGEG